MDRARKDALAERISSLAARGAAVVVATHDTEFAAPFADRVVLMGQGVVIADGPPPRCWPAAGTSPPRSRARSTARRRADPRAGRRGDRAGAGAMTWQTASFVILGLVLAGGFGWYERRRPPARVVALVAAMAALAVVGRLAFAAFPNVKPTTDIVLFAGYALGPVPGFMVGAITAIASNVFLGQGPWTVWQMVAWGGVGVGGALLARATAAASPAGSLAIACGVAGLAFGAFMDVYQWTLAAKQDFASYLVIAGSSLPYNLAHAIGNVVFCLLIGPVFIRALRRYRRRFEVRWAPALGPAALAAGGRRPGPACLAPAAHRRRRPERAPPPT